MAGSKRKTGVKGQARKKRHECMFCGKCFARSFALEVHVNGHINERAYHCSQCDANYTHPRYLKRHVDAVHLQIRFQCDRCLKWYSDRTNLWRHKYHGHCLGSRKSLGSEGKKPKPTTLHSKRAIHNKKLPDHPPKTQAQEKICQLKRSARRRLTKKTQKTLDKESTSTRESSSSSLSHRNQVRRTKSQKCSIETEKSATKGPPTSQQSVSKRNSTNYMKLIDGKKRFACQLCLCDKYYTDYSNLIRHCKRSHKEYKPTFKSFNCPFCSARFTLAESLRRHKRSHHSDVIESTEKVKVTPVKQFVKQSKKIPSMENAEAVAGLEPEPAPAPALSSGAAPLPRLQDFMAWRDRLEKICEEKRKTYDPKSAYFLSCSRYNPAQP